MRRLIIILPALLLLTCKDNPTDPGVTIPDPEFSTIQEMVLKINIDSLEQTVRELSGVSLARIGGQDTRILTRRTGTDGNRLAAQYILERLSAYGYAASYHRTDLTKPNVIATRLGAVNEQKRIILCAHFDNTAASDTIPGADDNASGTAAVIEAARVLSAYTTHATVIFALFNEEEQGLVGSREYADEFKSAEYSDTYVINMDMIAWDFDNDRVLEIHARDAGASPQLADTLVYLNWALGLGLNTIVHNPGTNRSDHAPFWNVGRSAVLLIEELYGGDFNAYYHSPQDRIDHFNSEFYHQSARLGTAAVALLAGISVIS